MKALIKQILALAILLATTVVLAGSGDALLAFSTKGPDRYADGTPVQVGEAYALVWTRSGCEFAGVDMNGRAVDTNNSAVVVALPLAKAGRRGVHCPLTLFQIDESYVAAHRDGTFALVLLDTRRANANGELVATGDAKRVNGWGFATKARVKAITSSNAIVNGSAAKGEAAATTTATSAVPAGEKLPQPKITGISVRDGYVVLTVKGTSPRMIYNVASGATPGRRDNRRAAAGAVQGRADREITVVAPRVAGQNFFQIIRN